MAGLLIVASIIFSAGYIFWETIQKFVDPQPLRHPGWVAAASVVGFLGNEMVALLQIRVGREMGSEAMVMDGLHARMDGLTSLAVVIAVVGTWLSFPILDPIVGAVIGVVILFIARDAIISTWYRLMDAVDPEIVERTEQTIGDHPQVKAIHRLQMRWLGHRLHAETVIGMETDLTTGEIEAITDEVSHELYHAIPNLADVTVAVVPWSPDGQVFWQETAHHRDAATSGAADT